MVSRDGRGKDSRRQAGPVRGGAGRLSPPELPRSRRGGRAHHPRCGVRRGAGTADGAVLHRTLPGVGNDDRAGDGGLRAGGPSGDGSAAGAEGRRRGDGGSAARRGSRAGRGAPVRELETSAGARPRDVHAGHGAARSGARGGRRARREGGRGGGRRLDVLRHRRRSPARARGRAERGGYGAARAMDRARGARMVTAEALTARRQEISGSRDLAALVARLAERAAPLVASGHLDEDTAKGVGQVADEAANLIGEFDEGFSNRQTWNNAALTAIAVWFEDE